MTIRHTPQHAGDLPHRHGRRQDRCATPKAAVRVFISRPYRHRSLNSARKRAASGCRSTISPTYHSNGKSEVPTPSRITLRRSPDTSPTRVYTANAGITEQHHVQAIHGHNATPPAANQATAEPCSLALLHCSHSSFDIGQLSKIALDYTLPPIELGIRIRTIADPLQERAIQHLRQGARMKIQKPFFLSHIVRPPRKTSA